MLAARHMAGRGADPAKHLAYHPPPGPATWQESKLEVTMAQHLLAAADRFQLIRLRCICEQRLCETVEVR